jgi:hypothetical protein
MKNLIRLVLVVSISMVSSSCANIFREGARKEFDAAYIFDAKKLMDQQDWTGALTKLAHSGVTSYIGGGDTVSVAHSLNLLRNFSFVSLGGGAMLDFLASGTLPGIDAVTK